MKSSFILLFLLLAVQGAYAQQEKVVMRFRDAVSDAPLDNVGLFTQQGIPIATSDSAGYCVVAFGNSGYMLAVRAGYTIDTVRTPGMVVYMQPISVEMSTTIVRSSKTGKLLHNPNEYVVDYAFAGGHILAATYSGNNGGNAKIFLLDKEGTVLAICKVPHEPLALYKSCVGNYYCVCEKSFYSIQFASGGINLKAEFKIGLLPGLQQCEHAVNGNFFYRIGDIGNFRMKYGMIARGDSVFKPMVQFDEEEVARESFIEKCAMAYPGFEDYDIYIRQREDEYIEMNQRANYRKRLLHDMWNNGSYAHINMPMFSVGDSLVIFDYFKKRILFYNQAGRPLGQSIIHFEWKQSQQFEILKDEAQDRFYIHRYDNKSAQTIEELDVRTGNVVSIKIPVSKALAERVRVQDGDIYFLWQGKGGGTRQLYVQREDITSSLGEAR